MSLIAVGTEPHGVVRIFFDCRPVDPDRREEKAIRSALERAAEAVAAEPKSLARAA